MLVQQILKSKADDGVVTVAPQSRVSEAAALMAARGIGALVVSGDGKRAEGIISERDLVRSLGRRGPVCLNDTVASMMTRDPETCALDEAVESVMTRMTEGRFRHLPVVEGGEMVGLISIGDVVKARLTELAMEKDALEGMIKGF